MVALTVLLWVTAPVWLLVAAALSPRLPGRWRPLRLLWLAILYATCESVLLVVLFGLWLASGFGRRMRTPYFEGIHYDLVQGLLWVFFREARRVLNLSIVTTGPTPDAHPGRPILVCCRHAGPGDSFTLIHALMHDYAARAAGGAQGHAGLGPGHRRPAQPDPGPVHLTQPGGRGDLESQIAALAADLDENDAFVIFPEGGNFTPERRDPRHRAAAQAGHGADGGPRGGHDQRARTATRRLPGRARRRARRRRGAGRPHRARPHAHRG